MAEAEGDSMGGARDGGRQESPPSAAREPGGQRARHWPRRLALRAGYAASCAVAALVLVASGFSYLTVRNVESIGSSDAIKSGPSIGAQNILLMGLESRTYWNGTILPPGILSRLHAGSSRAVASGTGGNDTNTLILIHIFAGGKKAVGFSIPRDDWVQFAGTVGPEQAGKVDQAYGVSMFYDEQQLAQRDPAMPRDRRAFLGNEAGQAAAVATVEQLTGVRIDHFAAVNLYGFYELARVVGGVEVCLNHAVDDPNSGADFPAGYQHLDASQALAFVRQRDGLPNGDLDRTHRQQAFLDSVMAELRGDGVLDDLTKVQALLNVARKYVMADAGWNLLDFAAQMRSLTNKNLVFYTLPIVGYETIDGQDANVVNPSYVKSIVQSAFYPPATPKASPASTKKKATVDVYNGGHTADLAHRVSAVLVQAGYRAGQIGDTSYRSTTAVRYGRGGEASARAIARLFGVRAVASASVRAGDVEVLLGANATVPEIGTPSPSPSPSPTVAMPTAGPQGGAVSSENGIPCVN
jgi:LCP family protein required for cell wall assembly